MMQKYIKPIFIRGITFQVHYLQNGLEMDWFDNPVNHTCYNPKNPILPNFDLTSRLYCHELKDDYFPRKFSMKLLMLFNDIILII